FAEANGDGVEPSGGARHHVSRTIHEGAAVEVGHPKGGKVVVVEAFHVEIVFAVTEGPGAVRLNSTVVEGESSIRVGAESGGKAERGEQSPEGPVSAECDHQRNLHTNRRSVVGYIP